MVTVGYVEGFFGHLGCHGIGYARVGDPPQAVAHAVRVFKINIRHFSCGLLFQMAADSVCLIRVKCEYLAEIRLAGLYKPEPF